MLYSVKDSFAAFGTTEDGASLVEYSIALIVVALIGAVIFSLGGNIAGVINNSAGAF